MTMLVLIALVIAALIVLARGMTGSRTKPPSDLPTDSASASSAWPSMSSAPAPTRPAPPVPDPVIATDAASARALWTGTPASARLASARTSPAIEPPTIAEIAIRVLPVTDEQKTGARISADRDFGVEHDCDLVNWRCSCDSWTERRGFYPEGSLGRLCGHLRQALHGLGLIQCDDADALDCFLENGGTKVWRAYFEAGGAVYFAHTPDTGWIDVFVRKRRKGDPLGNHTGPFERYGWSEAEDRWSYGDGPDGAREVRVMMKEVERHCEQERAATPRAIFDAIAAAKARREQQQAVENAKTVKEYEDRRSCCYLCAERLPLPDDPAPGTLVTCPVCGLENLITQSGSANSAKRIAVYRKYDGDLYDKSIRGLQAIERDKYDTALNHLRADRDAGRVNPADYQTRQRALKREYDKSREALEIDKESAMKVIRAEEKAILKKLGR